MQVLVLLSITLYICGYLLMCLSAPIGGCIQLLSYWYVIKPIGPPSVGVDGGNNCADNNNWVVKQYYAYVLFSRIVHI